MADMHEGVTGHLRPFDAPGDEVAFRCQRCDQWIYNYGSWENEECAS